MPKIAKKNIKKRVMLELSKEDWEMLGWAKQWVQFDLEDLHLPKKFTAQQMKEAFINQIPGIPPSMVNKILNDYKVYHNKVWVAGFWAISSSPEYPKESLMTNGRTDD